MPSTRPSAKLYISTVVVVGLAVVLQSLIAVVLANPIRPEWLILAALTVLTGSFTVKVPSMTARLTVSETFVFASVLLFGVSCGTLTVVLETLVIAFWAMREKRSLHRAVFNVAASALSIWIAATAFFRLAGTGPLLNHTVRLSEILGPLVVLTIVFFFLNSWLVAIAVGIEKGQSPLQIWWKNFTWVSINYFSGASVAAVIVTYASPLDERALFGTFIVTVPLLVVCYLTFRTAMARVEETNQHLSELNRLYLSTVETLAMAIDAKDQVTHGHIRRVQSQAVNLAREIGVKDQTLLKAIEAAALLHDMGKLAVPEYILNKPGKLTDAEFEKMKLHATVGADILSAIEFPYPVVPIVRHHHESWNGTGYPAGLKGTDIPIGARILSVVDCYDALTSDRPYRRRMSDAEALAILYDRRGSMYDPMIVDAFSRIQGAAPREIETAHVSSHVLKTIAHSHTPTTEENAQLSDQIIDSADELLSVYQLARAVAGHVSITDAAAIIEKHLARLIPSSLCIFFIYDKESDELEARHVVGDHASRFVGMRIAAGQRISGWAASNRKTVVNSDAMLDLYDSNYDGATVNLRSCLSTSLVAHDELIGALSLYSTELNGFNDDQRRLIESVARQIGHILYRAREFDSSTHRDLLTGLPHVDQLERVIESILEVEPCGVECHALILIEVQGLEGINATYGRSAGDEVLRYVVRQAQSALRAGDILFRHSGDDFVAFLSQAKCDTECDTVDIVSRRIIDQISRASVLLSSAMSITVHVSVTQIPLLSPGAPVKDLISRSRERVHGRSSRHEHPPLVH
jgi:diguanylate cyclase (GGDEF)-like protein/putative nucleotidyltransferase with HDIG domain